MTDPLTELDKAGEILRAFGEPNISLTFWGDEPKAFSVGLRASPGNGGCDTFGHADTPAEAYRVAKARRDATAETAAIRARHRAEAERRAEAEIAALTRQDIAA